MKSKLHLALLFGALAILVAGPMAFGQGKPPQNEEFHGNGRRLSRRRHQRRHRLHEADVGISVDSAADVAKDAADSSCSTRTSASSPTASSKAAASSPTPSSTC